MAVSVTKNERYIRALTTAKILGDNWIGSEKEVVLAECRCRGRKPLIDLARRGFRKCEHYA